MSMLRRPLTQLELCEDDIQWLSEQLAKKETGFEDEVKYEVMDVDEDEPMDQSEPTGKKDVPGTSGEGAQFTDQGLSISSARTPVSGASVNLSTPVNPSSSNEMMALPPPVRLARAGRRQRDSRVVNGDVPLMFNAYDTPQQPAGGSNGSPTPSDSPESPNAHLYSTPINPTSSSGGPSSNTRSQRH
ncbi:Protein CBR-CDC-26 [Caenorhabditis briggsae]|uniref:Protein CBR-CDC-26 n=1 Tax=Caenorhabditis briggsae TaxID=6238 RepID=A8XFH4_CAEBR|nr:Protein CBR-CDC-26 [Caenorhabditis briggsae]CAP31435.2 Protein CBR-CDC-26 [Caenorhabditis briggsae]